MEFIQRALLDKLIHKPAEWGPTAYARLHPSQISQHTIWDNDDPLSIWAQQGQPRPDFNAPKKFEDPHGYYARDPIIEGMDKAVGVMNALMGVVGVSSAAGRNLNNLRRGERDAQGRNMAGRIELPKFTGASGPLPEFLSEPPKQLKILDLFGGLGGWSNKARERGHKVFTADWDPKFNSDYQGDIRNFRVKDMPFKPDVVCASPDCTEFARWRMRGMNPAIAEGYRTGRWGPPSTDLVEHSKRIIDEANPKAWILENVHGSNQFIAPVLGSNFKDHYGPFFLWGDYPKFDVADPRSLYGKSRVGSGPNQAAERAVIPDQISHGFLNALERASLPQPGQRNLW